ncbi:MAG: hypothetical protein K9N47_05645 [Prosthecobacter sp.]|uniref:hypothetical protein n=1 Tax=Prosthecobacter sp. TaxID=1965333 RepID=UPI0025D1CD12|nr:hypothetical protein [Prosthecobacter sp.]MCF7785584.1 hypothetical protein [Prosthecobacter sp.]
MSWVRHPGRFRCALNSFLYGFISSRDFAALMGTTTKRVMQWRDRRSGPPQSMLPLFGYAVHQLVEQQVIPTPHCITKLNKIMGFTPSPRTAA